MTLKEKEIFDYGAVCALARLIEIWDQPTMAREIADILGVDFTNCAEYDVEFFRRDDPSVPKGKK